MHRKHRDRHGRGLRGPILPDTVPGWRTRAQAFDDALARELTAFRRHLGESLDRYDFAVLDVPTADRAPWESGVPLARYLPFERPSKIRGRFIFYRHPIEQAMRNHQAPRNFLHEVVLNQLAMVFEVEPDQLDYR
ncbi:MAG: metallopeptidase family protein [Actinomycetaceae bacterium]|nr:metallopeptidase family protein [Actinomycetaceae bacterium]